MNTLTDTYLRPNRPLCPHCYREACPWLGDWAVTVHFNDPPPRPEVCPFHVGSLPPGTAKRVRERLDIREYCAVCNDTGFVQGTDDEYNCKACP